MADLLDQITNVLENASLTNKSPEELRERRARGSSKRITLPRYQVTKGTRRTGVNDRLDRWYVVDTNEDETHRPGEGWKTRREARAEQRRLERGE